MSVRSKILYVVTPLSLAAAVIGISSYLTHENALKASKKPAVDALHAGGKDAKFACPVAFPAEASGAEVHSIDQKAQKLMSGGKFEKALAAYQELAKKDPAFPGLDLDLSMAYSRLNKPMPAKQAIDAQLAISMCLAQLFPNELEPYCKAEGFASTAACVKEIGSVQQSAYIQAALVQMDVDHAPKSGSVPKPSATQVAELKLPKPATQPVKELPKAKAPHKVGLNSLASGEGTDAALGAYSK